MLGINAMGKERCHIDYVCMLFGLKKCCWTKRWNIVTTEGTAQPEGSITITEDSYKYLENSQANETYKEVTVETVG